MSYINEFSSEFITSKITKRGRKMISKGNFVIKYFQIGDSEFDYSDPFSGLTEQSVFTPFDIESGVKYPYKLDNDEVTTTFGVPVDMSGTYTIRNVMDNLSGWTTNIVWSEKPIGYEVSSPDSILSGFTSNNKISTKSLLGYTTSNQIYSNILNVNLPYGTSYVNSFNEEIELPSEEQRCVLILHYTQENTIEDPEISYTYDDYISNNDDVNVSIIDLSGTPITDVEYFEITFPGVNYHRSSGTGLTLKMGDTNFYLRSSINEKHSLLYRYLIDENGNKVGKIFNRNKVIVIDDQEIIEMLDSGSLRTYSLPAPKTYLIPNDSTGDPLLDFEDTDDKTVWVTYMFDDQNVLPCNYYTKVSLIYNLDDNGCKIPYSSNVGIKFNVGSFSNLPVTPTTFSVLVQITDFGERPSSDLWRKITLETGLSGTSQLEGKTYVIDGDLYDLASTFDGTYLTTQFGGEESFSGSIKLVRASDIEQMKFLINLPSTQFNETQNPTYITNRDKYMTEIALLDDMKEPLVVGKFSKPIKRVGTQIISINLDF